MGLPRPLVGARNDIRITYYTLMTHKNKLLAGSLAVVAAALLWSLDGTFLRPQLYSLPSALVVFIEHTLGFIVLLPFLIIYRAQIKQIAKKEWLAVFWVALFGGALGTTFITKALFLTGFHDISVVILLQKFQPLFAIILAAIFLRERFPRQFYLYAAAAVVGGYFVTFKNPLAIAHLPSGPAMVAVFALLAAFAWGSSTTFGKYSLKNINYGLLAALRFGLTVIIMIAPALYFYRGQIPAVTAGQWGTFAIIVFTSGAAAMFLYYYGLKKIPASIATLCELSWPVSAVIFDYFLNHNVLSATQIAGALLLIAAVYKASSLNRSYTIVGKVMAGNNIGEKIGAPTANLDPSLAGSMPHGLYFCDVSLNCHFSESWNLITANHQYRGLLFFGYNSLKGEPCLEIHFLNFNENIYGKEITINTTRYLRSPKKFTGETDLSEQIKKDLEMLEKIV